MLIKHIKMTLTETEKLLTEKLIFEPQKQLDLLFYLHSSLSWKKRYNLYRKLCSSLLIFELLPYVREWMKNDQNKKLFFLKILYFLEEKYIKEHVGPSIEEIIELQPDKELIALKRDGDTIEGQEISSVIAEPVPSEVSVPEPVPSEVLVAEPVPLEVSVPEPLLSEPAIPESVSLESVISEPAVSEPVPSESDVSEPSVSEPVPSEPSVADKHEEEVIDEIISIIEYLRNSPSSEVSNLTSRVLSCLSLKHEKFFHHWKKLLHSGNNSSELFAISGAGEFLSSEREEFRFYIDCLKNYYEAQEDKEREKIKQTLGIKSRDFSVVSLGAFHVFSPDTVSAIIERDCPLHICNIIRSFSDSLLYLSDLPKSERLIQGELFYRNFVDFKNKKLLPGLPFFKYSGKEEDFELYRVFLKVCQEFCHAGIYKAYTDMMECLNYELPQELTVEVIFALRETNLLCKNRFLKFFKDIEEKIPFEYGLMEKFFLLEDRFEHIKSAPWSPETLEAIVKLIKEFDNIFYELFYGGKPYDRNYYSVIKIITSLFRKKFTVQINELLHTIKYYVEPEYNMLIERIEKNLTDRFWQKNLKMLIEDSTGPVLQYGAIQILSGDNNFALLKPAFKSGNPVIINSLSEGLYNIFVSLINNGNAVKIIEYLRVMSYEGSPWKLYSEIISRKFPWPLWFLNLVKSFSEFSRDMEDLKKSDSKIFQILKTITSVKEEKVKKNIFYRTCHELLSLSGSLSISTLHTEMERINFKFDEVAAAVSSEHKKEFLHDLSAHMDSMKKKLKHCLLPNQNFSLTMQEENLINFMGEVEYLANLFQKKGFYFFDPVIALALEKIFHNLLHMIEKTVKLFQDLRKEIERRDLLFIYNQYLRLKESKLLDNNIWKNIKSVLQKEVAEIIFTLAKVPEKYEIVHFLKDLYEDSSEESAFINLFCRILFLQDIKSLKVLASVFSEYFIKLHKKDDFQAILDLVIKMIEHGGRSEIFSFIKEEFIKKKAPDMLISLLDSYIYVLKKLPAPEQIYTFTQKLKDWKNKYSVNFARLEAYMVLLELARSTDNLNRLSEKLHELQERGKLFHALYSAFETNGFSLVESKYASRSFHYNIELDKERMKNEHRCLKIISYIDELRNEVDYFLGCTFAQVEDRIIHLKNSITSVENIRLLTEDFILDPLLKHILVDLFAGKLCSGKEEEIEPDDTFSLVKLLDRWHEVLNLIKADNIEELTEKIYYRKDLCNYLQLLSGKEKNIFHFKEVRDFIAGRYCSRYDFDRAFYMRYIDKTHKDSRGLSCNLPSPFSEKKVTGTKFGSTVFTSVVIAIFFICFLLPPLTGLYDQSLGNLLLKYLFSFSLYGSLAFMILYYILYLFRKINFSDIDFLLPSMAGKVAGCAILLVITGGGFSFMIKIQDSLYLLMFIFSLGMSLFYLTIDVSSRRNIAHVEKLHPLFIISGALPVLLLTLTYSFIISIIFSTFFPHPVNTEEFGNIPFLLGTVSREIMLPDWLTDLNLVIYPSLVYTWSSIILFFSIFLHVFPLKRFSGGIFREWRNL